MSLCWQHVDDRVEAQGRRISCKALNSILGKIKEAVGGSSRLQTSQNSESFLIFRHNNAHHLPLALRECASTVLCNRGPAHALCVSLESTCHFLGSCLAITVRKELNNTAVPNTMEVHSTVLHDWNVRMFKHFQPHENTFGHVWNKASREQPWEIFL